jgi:hypothetical protein
MATATIKTLTFDLHNEAFIGYTRRKYDGAYTTIPKDSYSEEVAAIMEALEKTLGVQPESNPLTIVANGGYAQRLSGPRIFADPETGLKLRYDRELIPVTRVVSEDETVSFEINGVAVALSSVGDDPVFTVPVGKGKKVVVPFHTVRQEVKLAGLAQVANIEDGNYVQISPPPGSGSTVNFSALKNLPIGRYKVEKTETATGGAYGPKIKVTIVNPEEQEIVCSVSVDGSWSTEPVTVAAGARLVVDANTSLTKILQGTQLAASDKVVLDVFGKREDPIDKKVYVSASFDFTAN